MTISTDAPFGHLAVYLGAELDGLTAITSNSPPTSSASQLSFDAVTGTDYAISFQSLGGFAGDFRLSLLLDARELSGLRISSRGRLALDLCTTVDRTWSIEATTNLVDWSPVATSPVSNGLIRFLDPPVSGRQQRFFRPVAAQ